MVPVGLVELAYLRRLGAASGQQAFDGDQQEVDQLGIIAPSPTLWRDIGRSPATEGRFGIRGGELRVAFGRFAATSSTLQPQSIGSSAQVKSVVKYPGGAIGLGSKGEGVVNGWVVKRDTRPIRTGA
jgi:hypothetical protein